MFEKSKHIHKINITSFREDGVMQIISGAIGREKVYYEAPPRENLDLEMDAFIAWYNNTPPCFTHKSSYNPPMVCHYSSS